MKKRSNPFKISNEQKKNRQTLFYEFLLIVGAILLGEGIVSMIPSSTDKSALAGLGFVLILIALLSFKLKK